MKKTIIIGFITILLILFLQPVSAFAEELSPEAEISSQFNEILSDYDIQQNTEDISGLSFDGFITAVKDRFLDSSFIPMKLLGTILLVIVVTSALKSIGGGMFDSCENIYSSICVLSAVAVIASPLFTVFGQAISAVKTGGSFVAVFIPVFTGISAVCGNITSAGVYDLSVLAASEVIVQIVSNLMMPVLSAAVMLSVSGGVFQKSGFSGVVQLLKKIVIWCLTISMTLFTGFVTLKCTLTAKTDGAATKTARFMISGLVPVVGGAVSDAYATVRSSFDILKGTVGSGGIYAIVLILLPPVLQIIVYRAVMWTGSAAAGLFGESSMKELLESLDSGLSIAQSVLICYGLMFVLCTSILMKMVG